MRSSIAGRPFTKKQVDDLCDFLRKRLLASPQPFVEMDIEMGIDAWPDGTIMRHRHNQTMTVQLRFNGGVLNRVQDGSGNWRER